MNDQAAKEEADQQRRTKIDAGLVVRRRSREAEEEQEAAEEQRRVVRVHDRPGHEEQMHHGNPRRHRRERRTRGGVDVLVGPIDVRRRRPLRQRRHFAAEQDVVEDVARHHRERRTPAEVPEHERRVPAPGARHHQDRRRREVRQRAADRDVHEQQAQRRVLQPRRRLQIVELPRQQQRRDRHRPRLGHERPQQRCNGEDGEPPGARRAAAKIGELPQRRLRQVHDRPRRGQRHDHDHEHRLGVVHAVVDVVRGRRPPEPRRDGRQQHHRPQPEHDLDFTEEVQDLRRDARRRLLPPRCQARLMAMLNPMRQRHEPGRRERVQDRQHEDRGRDRVEGFVSDPRRQRVEQPLPRHHRVRRQRRGKRVHVHYLFTLVFCRCSHFWRPTAWSTCRSTMSKIMRR